MSGSDIVVGVEDGVVGGPSRADGVIGAVVDCKPLPIGARDRDAGGILLPSVAVIVRDRAVECSERAFEITEVDKPLIVDGVRGIAAARRRVRPQRGGADDVELISAVDRAVHERLGRAESPGAAVPVFRVLVEVQEWLTFRPLEIGHGRRPKGDRAGRIVGWWWRVGPESGDRQRAVVGLRSGPADKAAGNDLVGARNEVLPSHHFDRIAAVAGTDLAGRTDDGQDLVVSRSSIPRDLELELGRKRIVDTCGDVDGRNVRDRQPQCRRARHNCSTRSRAAGSCPSKSW